MARIDDKRRTRLNLVSHFLKSIPYEDLPRDEIKLPRRQKPNGYEEPVWARHWVPDTH